MEEECTTTPGSVSYVALSEYAPKAVPSRLRIHGTNSEEPHHEIVPSNMTAFPVKLLPIPRYQKSCSTTDPEPNNDQSLHASAQNNGPAPSGNQSRLQIISVASVDRVASREVVHPFVSFAIFICNHQNNDFSILPTGKHVISYCSTNHTELFDYRHCKCATRFYGCISTNESWFECECHSG